MELFLQLARLLICPVLVETGIIFDLCPIKSYDSILDLTRFHAKKRDLGKEIMEWLQAFSAEFPNSPEIRKVAGCKPSEGHIIYQCFCSFWAP